jgi:hypothetical protein
VKRKPRDTSYSMTYKLINLCGEEKLRSVWEKHGMYKASEILSEELDIYISPSVIRYLSYKFNWIREVSDHTLPFVKGVIAGTMDPSYYRHVKIVGLPQSSQNQQTLSA